MTSRKIAPEIYQIRDLHKIYPGKKFFSQLKKIYFCCEVLSIYKVLLTKSYLYVWKIWRKFGKTTSEYTENR